MIKMRRWCLRRKKRLRILIDRQSSILDRDGVEQFFVVQNHSGAQNDRGKWIVHDSDWKVGYLPEKDIEILEKGPTAHQHDPFVRDIRRQFRRCPFEGDPDRIDDHIDRFRQGLPDLLLGHANGLRDAIDQVPALHLDAAGLSDRRIGGAFFPFQDTGRSQDLGAVTEDVRRDKALDVCGNKIPMVSRRAGKVFLGGIPPDPLSQKTDTWLYDPLMPGLVSSRALSAISCRSSPLPACSAHPT